MGKALLLLGGTALAAVSLVAQKTETASIAAHGWTVAADAKLEQIKVEHAGLGTVMENVRLFRLEGSDETPLHSWTFGKSASDQLTIETAQPHTFWRFDLDNGSLTIASTASDAFLNAIVAAPETRQLARLMDPFGVPVTWAGTDEAHDGYGAPETRRESHLPRSNSDVMMFALGPISASTLHSLFDRPTDIAIDFPEKTSLIRGSDKILQAKIPVLGATVLRVIPDYFTKTLGVPSYTPFDDSHFPRPPVVWSSWTSYYEDVREDDIVRNADWLAANLKPYGFQYVQLDDGYDRGKLPRQ